MKSHTHIHIQRWLGNSESSRHSVVGTVCPCLSTHTHTLSLSPSHTHTHTHTHTHREKHTHRHTHIHTFSVTPLSLATQNYIALIIVGSYFSCLHSPYAATC